jgi:hypothetical protein
LTAPVRVGAVPLMAALAALTCGPVRAQAPRHPFAGVYGSTAGAGSIVAWDRLGGDNPAALGAAGWMLSAAGYAPFGLEAVRVTEAGVARDAGRWGVSAAYRGLRVGGERLASVTGIQGAVRAGRGLTAGIGGAYRAEPGQAAVEATGGALWRPRAWATLGAFAERAWRGGFAGETSPFGETARAGLGVDAGSGFRGTAWRVGAETVFARRGPRAGWKNRFAAGVHLHALLSVYAGWDPPRETAALGVRFGMGGWEGFSALRRHAALGGESVQGLRWRREALP